MFYYSILGLFFSAALLSCGDPVGGPGTSPVFLTVQAKEGEWGVMCDVYDPAVQGNVTWDIANLVVKSVYRDQSANMEQTVFADVVLNEQRVTYYRADGNPNVPEPFHISLNGGTVPNAGELALKTPIVRANAKLESPLKELAFGGGEGEIYMTAVVQFYGKDLAGNSAYGKIEIPIWAKDY